MDRVFVGVDVSKDSFSAAGLDAEGSECFSGSYSMDSDGFGKFLEMVTAHCLDLQKVLVGMEWTGCYHLNLFSFLISRGIQAVVINPLLIANFAKRSLRKTKTDKKDARTIAKFLMENREEISQLPISQELQDLRDLARERESVSHLITATKVEIKRVLRTTFPELESVGDLFTRSMLRLVKEYPSARRVKMARLKDLAKALNQPHVGNKLSFSVEDILRAAHRSIATVSPAKEVILQGKIATLVHLQERLDELTKLLTEVCKATRVEDWKILRSIKGVGPKTAVPFLAEMGSIENFSSPKKLIAFAGMDPSVCQSGKFIGKSKLSKRGNRHLRRAIYLMASAVVSQNAFFKAYFVRRKREGLKPQRALLATAHKLIRVIFAMLSHRTYFQVKMAQ
jgi:transposase